MNDRSFGVLNWDIVPKEIRSAVMGLITQLFKLAGIAMTRLCVSRERPFAPGDSRRQGITLGKFDATGQKISILFQPGDNGSCVQTFFPVPPGSDGREQLVSLQRAADKINQDFPHRHKSAPADTKTPPALMLTAKPTENVDAVLGLLREQTAQMENNCEVLAPHLAERKKNLAQVEEEVNNLRIRHDRLAAEIAELRDRKLLGHLRCSEDRELEQFVGKERHRLRDLKEAEARFEVLTNETNNLSNKCDACSKAYVALGHAAEQLEVARFMREGDRKRKYEEIVGGVVEILPADQVALMRRHLVI